MSETRDLDMVALDRLRKMGGDEFLGELIGLFLEHAPKKIAEAEAGEKAGDMEAVERAVHALKSSAGNIGANALMELAGRIEQLAEEQKGGSIPPLLHELEEAFSRLRVRLEIFRKGGEE